MPAGQVLILSNVIPVNKPSSSELERKFDSKAGYPVDTEVLSEVQGAQPHVLQELRMALSGLAERDPCGGRAKICERTTTYLQLEYVNGGGSPSLGIHKPQTFKLEWLRLKPFVAAATTSSRPC